MPKCFSLAIALVLGLALSSLAHGQNVQTIKIPKGQTADLWFGANAAGKVHVAVRTKDGRNKLNMWWITWGVGSTTQIGDWGPNGEIDIPITWWKGIVSARLRGTAFDEPSATPRFSAIAPGMTQSLWYPCPSSGFCSLIWFLAEEVALSQVVIKNRILNSPFVEPSRHFRFDERNSITSETSPRAETSKLICRC